MVSPLIKRTISISEKDIENFVTEQSMSNNELNIKEQIETEEDNMEATDEGKMKSYLNSVIKIVRSCKLYHWRTRYYNFLTYCY